MLILTFSMKEVGHHYSWRLETRNHRFGNTAAVSSFQKEETSGAVRKSPISSTDSAWKSHTEISVSVKPGIHHNSQGTGVNQCYIVLPHLTSTQMLFSFLLADEINMFHPKYWLDCSDACFPPVAKEAWQLNQIAHSAPLCHDLFVL